MGGGASITGDDLRIEITRSTPIRDSSSMSDSFGSSKSAAAKTGFAPTAGRSAKNLMRGNVFSSLGSTDVFSPSGVHIPPAPAERRRASFSPANAHGYLSEEDSVRLKMSSLRDRAMERTTSDDKGSKGSTGMFLVHTFF